MYLPCFRLCSDYMYIVNNSSRLKNCHPFWAVMNCLVCLWLPRECDLRDRLICERMVDEKNGIDRSILGAYDHAGNVTFWWTCFWIADIGQRCFMNTILGLSGWGRRCRLVRLRFVRDGWGYVEVKNVQKCLPTIWRKTPFNKAIFRHALERVWKLFDFGYFNQIRIEARQIKPI